MKRAAVLVNPRMSHQGSWAEAFATGLRRHGWKADIVTDYERADLFAMWSVRRGDMIERARKHGAEVVICERGYLGDRKKYCSVSFGGELNGRAEFRGPFHDPSRFDRLFGNLMRPWNPPADGYALMMGQVPGDMSVRGFDLNRWYRETKSALKARGWKVKFRPHPLADRRAGIINDYRVAQQADLDDLRADMEGAAVVVTFNSNTGVDAALAGRPVIALDRGSMAWDVAGHDLDTVIMPDRGDWAKRLAWCQWTKEELASGEAWEAISWQAQESSTAA